MKNEIATLAGGCFWGMEELVRKQPGVVGTEVGYTGGAAADARYERVKTGRTGHAEALRVEFDPAKTSFENLLLFFFRIHDPTTVDRQGNDRGSQYRSAVFYHSEEQRATAEKVKARVDASGAWGAPAATQIVPFTGWFRAEEFHQDYLQRIPDGYTCHFLRDVKF